MAKGCFRSGVGAGGGVFIGVFSCVAVFGERAVDGGVVVEGISCHNIGAVESVVNIVGWSGGRSIGTALRAWCWCLVRSDRSFVAGERGRLRFLLAGHGIPCAAVPFGDRGVLDTRDGCRRGGNNFELEQFKRTLLVVSKLPIRTARKLVFLPTFYTVLLVIPPKRPWPTPPTAKEILPTLPMPI